MASKEEKKQEDIVGLEYLDHLGFGDTEFEYNQKRHSYVKIAQIKYFASATKHSVNFIPTGTTYKVELQLIFEDRQVLSIRPESTFLTNRAKVRNEAVMKAASIFMNITFDQRIRRYEESMGKKKFVQWGRIQIHKNGDLFKNNEFKFNIRSPDVTVTLEIFAAHFIKKADGFLDKMKAAFSSRSQDIDLTVDKDCFLCLMKHHFGFTWRDTAVPVKAKAAAEVFHEALALLGAKIAAADGNVSPEELSRFQKYFGIDDEFLPNFRSSFLQAAKDDRSPSEVARMLYGLLSQKKEALEFLLAGLIQVAAADGELHPDEMKVIQSIAAEFHFSTQELNQLFAIFASDAGARGNARERNHFHDLQFHLGVLGLSELVDLDSIKKAYRDLVRRHHPDLLRAQGIAIDRVKAAEQILSSINVSYEWLEKYHASSYGRS